MVDWEDAGKPGQTAATGRADAREWRIAFFVKVVGLGMVLALGFTFASTHYLNRGFPHNTFLVGVADQFMDFFNVNAMSYGLDPYPERTPYPPFSILMARLFATGFDYSAYGPFGARASFAGLVSYSVLAVSFCAFFFPVIYRGIRTGDRARDWQRTVVLGASYPLLFALDRGNYVLAAFVFLFGFVHFYRRRPALANLFLALAISTKLYPAVFLVLLAADRRWRDCAAVVALTVVINLGAMLFFRGGLVTNVELFIRNVLIYAPAKPIFEPVTDAAWNLSFSNLVRVPYVVFFHDAPHELPLYYLAFTLAVVGILFRTLRAEPAFWKKILAVTIAQVSLPGLAADYNLLYLFIPVLLYFQEAGARSRDDTFYLVCLGLLFVPKHYAILGVHGLHVMTLQGFLDPLLLLALLLRVGMPRSAATVLGGGSLALLAGLACWVLAPSVAKPPAVAPSAPQLCMRGFALDGWLQPEGFTLTALSGVLIERPLIRLRGPIESATPLGSKLPGVKAKLVIPGAPTQPLLPASLVADGAEYVLTVEVDRRYLPPHTYADIRLSFDAWFVPKRLGTSADTRELVIPTPHSIALLPLGAGPAEGRSAATRP